MEVSERIKLAELRAAWLIEINKLGGQIYVIPDGPIKKQLEGERDQLIKEMRKAEAEQGYSPGE